MPDSRRRRRDGGSSFVTASLLNRRSLASFLETVGIVLLIAGILALPFCMCGSFVTVPPLFYSGARRWVLLMTIVAPLGAILLSAIFLVAGHRLRHRLPPPGRCPTCGYDLRALKSHGCPECGWRR